MNQMNLLVNDFVNDLDDEEIVIMGMKPMGDRQGNFSIAELMGEKLRFALTRACIQNPDVYHKVKSLFMKLGTCIEDVEKERSIMKMHRGKLN